MDSNAEKGVIIILFFFITMIPGSISVLLYSQFLPKLDTPKGRKVMSLLNCLAAGVFLATSLLILMAEGLEQFEEFKEKAGFNSHYPFIQLGIAAGLFMVALVERLAAHLSTVRTPEDNQQNKKKENFFEITQSVRTPEDNQQNKKKENFFEITQSGNSEMVIEFKDFRRKASTENENRKGSNISGRQLSFSISSCKLHSEVISRQSGLRAIVMLLAWSFHTLFDGLAVGLQESTIDIWITAMAIASHKVIAAFSMGLTLAMALSANRLKCFLLLFIHALVAPLGVGIGIAITAVERDVLAQLLTGSMLQALATGSFLYVTFVEMLMEELGEESSALKIFMMMLGFGLMAIVAIWHAD